MNDILEQRKGFEEDELTETDLEDGRKLILWELESVPLYRKYLGLLDYWFFMHDASARVVVSPEAGGCGRLMRYYESQFVWFRHVWAALSRYNYFNTYRPFRLNSKLPKRPKTD